ncbi:Sec-independent protein translocase protein TatB [Mycolicibacterium komossense]|jgi:sec-independent protein translocase protein TatB|uniref:Sec-independent protein translocase protein TatB n=1 Tax=Mycolicibacterium komossense TaxID=1779 RepID=A0ABT3CM45_9MYCO|nr:Sec-independent protein translocase protein TatB [Mycolicibacterium komossense]MCV7230525.1 Sec-independent protein translocase subunit TatB [Mycolicibacterium komossense]
MFENLGWGHLLVLGLVGLIVLGPERLPGAIRWAFTATRQTRDYISGVTGQLREDLGPEFEDLTRPIGELQKLRSMTPRELVTRHLLDGDDYWSKSIDTEQVSRQVQAGEVPVQANGISGDLSPARAQPRSGAAPFDWDAT